MTNTIEAPRSPARPARKRGTNWEKWGWIYMRASGVVLIVLGTLVVFTFDPCPPVAADAADLLPSFCSA